MFVGYWYFTNIGYIYETEYSEDYNIGILKRKLNATVHT